MRHPLTGDGMAAISETSEGDGMAQLLKQLQGTGGGLRPLSVDPGSGKHGIHICFHIGTDAIDQACLF